MPLLFFFFSLLVFDIIIAVVMFKMCMYEYITIYGE